MQVSIAECMSFYLWGFLIFFIDYLNSIREQVVSDLVDGTSELTINAIITD